MGGEWLWAGPCACVGRASDTPESHRPNQGRGGAGSGGEQAPGHSGVRGLQVLDITWILSKKHLELAEAKFTMQAEDLRQVRRVLGSEGRTRGEGMSWRCSSRPLASRARSVRKRPGPASRSRAESCRCGFSVLRAGYF